MSNDDMHAKSRQALADFLRAHRVRLTPASVGLPDGTRRRTPGLRREEVAQLSGISATWYSWIEQGRQVSVSPAALGRLCRTLGLTPSERAYLFELAGKHDPAKPLTEMAMDAPRHLVRAVNAIAQPAYLLDRLWRARAWNGAAAALFTGWLDAGPATEDRNLLFYMFCNPAARRLVVDWEDRARRLIAEFRLDHGRLIDDREMNALVADLRRRSAFFAKAWDEHAVIGREGGLRTFSHPAQGLLCFEQITFHLSGRPEFKLVMLVDTDGKGGLP